MSTLVSVEVFPSVLNSLIRHFSSVTMNFFVCVCCFRLFLKQQASSSLTSNQQELLYAVRG